MLSSSQELGKMSPFLYYWAEAAIITYSWSLVSRTDGIASPKASRCLHVHYFCLAKICLSQFQSSLNSTVIFPPCFQSFAFVFLRTGNSCTKVGHMHFESLICYKSDDKTSGLLAEEYINPHSQHNKA